MAAVAWARRVSAVVYAQSRRQVIKCSSTFFYFAKMLPACPFYPRPGKIYYLRRVVSALSMHTAAFMCI